MDKYLLMVNNIILILFKFQKITQYSMTVALIVLKNFAHSKLFRKKVVHFKQFTIIFFY